MSSNVFKCDGIEFYTGDRVTCYIEDEGIDDAKIYVADEHTAFICQDVIDGSESPDYLGYEFSWVIFTDDDFCLCRDEDVHELRLVDSCRKPRD